MVFEHRQQRRIPFHETDSAGIVFFANYFKWMDEAECEFFRSLNLPGPLVDHWGAVGKNALDWTIVNVSCEFLKPLVFDDLIEVHMWVKRKGTKSITFAFSFLKDGEQVARGEKINCCTQGIGHEHRAAPIPDYIGKLIEEAPWVKDGT